MAPKMKARETRSNMLEAAIPERGNNNTSSWMAWPAQIVRLQLRPESEAAHMRNRDRQPGGGGNHQMIQEVRVGDACLRLCSKFPTGSLVLYCVRARWWLFCLWQLRVEGLKGTFFAAVTSRTDAWGRHGADLTGSNRFCFVLHCLNSTMEVRQRGPFCCSLSRAASRGECLLY